jgi:hypothetical protein
MRLSCERAFVDFKIYGIGDTYVCRDAIASGEFDEVAWDEFVC